MLIGVGTLRRGHEWGDDFAWYILQAKSILNGSTNEFIQTSTFTNNESSTYVGPLAYPWGYPLILTPAYVIKGINPLALKLPALIFYAGFLVCLYGLVKMRLSRMESLLFVCLFAFNPLLLIFLDQILSDIPFLFFSTLSLWLIMQYEKHSMLDYAALGFSIACAFFIRTSGILLLASFFTGELLTAWKDKANQGTIKKHALNILVVGGTFGLSWLLYALLLPGGGESYFAQYQDFQIGTALKFVSEYFRVFSRFFGEHKVWRNIYYALFAFFLVGLWKRKWEDLIFIVFFILWMILLITWPSWQGPRFIFPVMPIFIYFTFQGMKFVLGKLPEKHAPIGQWVFSGFWSVVTIIFLFNSAVNAYANLQNDRTINGPFDPYSKEVYKYIQDNTPADSIIVFFKPRVMRLMTDRNSLMSVECNRVLKGDYLVLSRKVGENQQIPPEEIDSCNLPLDQVFKNTRFIIYEIQK